MESSVGRVALTRRRFLKTTATGALVLAASHPTLSCAETREVGSKEEVNMAYEAKDFSSLLGMEGFSDTLLNNHFTLYKGYVTNTNKALELLDGMLKGDKMGYEYGEVKRRLGWEFNGMRLHELYFGNLGGEAAIDKGGKLAKKLASDFGSYDAWEKDFKAVGGMRGIGWVALYQDTTNGKLINFWINEHDMGHPSGCAPILIMDVFEHAFMTDYGLKKADYIAAFFKNINWGAVEKRLK
jgi:Fe-Mn family superoxide dismutase